MTRVPRLWTGATIVVMAPGPSLTVADANFCRGRARVLAVKDAVRLAPWADVCYACDARWWNYVEGLPPQFVGFKYAMAGDRREKPWPRLQHLQNTGDTGLELDPSGLRTGKNSGYQAINLAVHFGVSKIVLLGYDMQHGPNAEHHFFGRHPWGNAPNTERFRPFFDTLVKPIADLGVEVVNATRRTKLDCWPLVDLEDVLPMEIDDALF